MSKFLYQSLLFFFFFSAITAQQIQNEVEPPYNIKTVSFVQNGSNVVPIFELGSSFAFQFDDLFGSEANYYFEILHCDYNWIPTDIPKTDYIGGLDNQRINDYSNSFNTLQIYSHYRLSFPNQFTTQIKLSGNYMLRILNEDRELVLSRKFILYENHSTVTAQVKRSRNLSNIDYKQNLDFAILSNDIVFQTPLQNVKVLLLQNGNFNTAIKNIVPQYTIGNQLVYKYDKETQFWGGNEFLYFENKDIRAASNNVAKVGSNGDIYNAHLYTNAARGNQIYTNYEDVNGNFVVKNINASNNDIEADYAWVYFTLSAPAFRLNKDIYITGMFNNYSLSPEYKMDYNTDKAVFEKAIMIKQGFTNFQYTVADKKGVIDYENAIDGNFYQTENEYTILVYYKEATDRYQRVIGKGNANSINIVN
ncbi:type IX secretion system plug protein [Flavobacterium notoginsengisoli]|uniref:type IX secretion system plug protein n=1 Tax=Flavobacterium notoginsengisoli TaxID=1478199 RepID=UPI00363C9C9F